MHAAPQPIKRCVASRMRRMNAVIPRQRRRGPAAVGESASGRGRGVSGSLGSCDAWSGHDMSEISLSPRQASWRRRSPADVPLLNWIRGRHGCHEHGSTSRPTTPPPWTPGQDSWCAIAEVGSVHAQSGQRGSAHIHRRPRVGGVSDAGHGSAGGRRADTLQLRRDAAVVTMAGVQGPMRHRLDRPRRAGLVSRLRGSHLPVITERGKPACDGPALPPARADRLGPSDS